MRGTKAINGLLERYLKIRVQRTDTPFSSLPHRDLSISHAQTGMVEVFNLNEVIGWVSCDSSELPIKILLCINGVPVHGTWANVDSSLNTSGTARGFYIGVKGIWKYCNKNDQITVCAGSSILPISGEGAFKSPTEDGKSNLKVLKRRLSNGYVFNKIGWLQLSMKLDVDRQNKMIALYKETAKILKKERNITPFIIYGSLLGHVREGGFIGHDDDFDIAYLSEKRLGEDASKELVEIAETLRDNGLVVELRATAIHVHDRDNPKLKIDLFHLYFNENDELAFPFGVAGTKHFLKKDWKGTTNRRFASHIVVAPKNARKLVECIYGESWRTPTPGFSWRHARTRRDEAGIVAIEMREQFNSIT